MAMRIPRIDNIAVQRISRGIEANLGQLGYRCIDLVQRGYEPLGDLGRFRFRTRLNLVAGLSDRDA